MRRSDYVRDVLYGIILFLFAGGVVYYIVTDVTDVSSSFIELLGYIFVLLGGSFLFDVIFYSKEERYQEKIQDVSKAIQHLKERLARKELKLRRLLVK